MRILILEDDPMIAIDLEEIVRAAGRDMDCILASTLEAGLCGVARGVDFAILDIYLGHAGKTSFPVASLLKTQGTPFCFLSCSIDPLPQRYDIVPLVAKPFRPSEISLLLKIAA